MEKLDINNILEIQEIKNLIRHKRNLITFFDELIEKVNIKINEEKCIEEGYDKINAFLEGISNR